MRRLALALTLSLSLSACPNSALQVRSLGTGSLDDRVVNLIESHFALIAQATSPLAASAAITSYCETESANLARIRAESDALSEEEAKALGARLEPRLTRLQSRAEEALGDKALMMVDQGVLAAMLACRPELGAPAP